MDKNNWFHDLFIEDCKSVLGRNDGESTAADPDEIVPIPADGNTRLWITIPNEHRIDVPLEFQQTVSEGVTVNWGDGSAPQTVSGTGQKSIVHTYAKAGDYEISIAIADGCDFVFGRPNNNTGLLPSTSLYVYANMVKKVYVGRNVTNIARSFTGCRSLKSVVIDASLTSIGESAFSSCYALRSIKLPDTLTEIGKSAFSQCMALRDIALPDNVTKILDGAFYYCYSLGDITLPKSLTTIGSNVFAYCHGMNRFVMPDSVTSIGSQAVNNCYSMMTLVLSKSLTTIPSSAFSYSNTLTNVIVPPSVTSIASNAFNAASSIKVFDFSQHTVVPTLGAASAFNGAPADCEILVPAALYDQWIAATNWSTHASKIKAV